MTARASSRVAAIAASLLLAACRRESEVQVTPGPDGKPVPTERAIVSLHFPAEDGFLHLEKREMSVPPPGDDRLEVVVGALLSGPRQRGLAPLFGPEVKAGNAFVDAHGVAYVDLSAEGHAMPPPSGSTLELLRVFGVVNTVLANDERARGVVLLWNGAQRQTFAGHVDTIRPLLANHRLVR
jgi:hypothetical protein